MAQNIKRLLVVILTVGVLFTSAAPISAEAASAKGWKKAYTKVLNNWKKYCDDDYLEMYFGDDYNFDKYFLCDIDRNKTPELILYSTSMKLSAVFTYSNGKIKYLMCDNFYKINKSRHTLVVKGHWHGAGGSGSKEYSIYKLSGRKLKRTYIDKLAGRYTISTGNGYRSGTKSQYDKIYKKEVKGGKSIKKYKKYALSNKKGLNKLQ